VERRSASERGEKLSDQRRKTTNRERLMTVSTPVLSDSVTAVEPRSDTSMVSAASTDSMPENN
jgi:hypothetical protein